MPIKTASVLGVALSDHFKNLDWQARSTTCTGKFVSASDLQKVRRPVKSVVSLGGVRAANRQYVFPFKTAMTAKL